MQESKEEEATAAGGGGGGESSTLEIEIEQGVMSLRGKEAEGRDRSVNPEFA